MKHPIITVGGLAFTLVLSGSPLLAEEQQQQMQGQSPPSQDAEGASDKTSDSLRKRADELSGKEVVTREGIHIGDVERVVRRAEDDKPYAIVSIGGFLDLGDKDVAVAMDQLRMGEHKVVLPHDIGSKVLVEGLPGWKSAEFEALADSDQVQIERADLAAFESEPRSRGQASGER